MSAGSETAADRRRTARAVRSRIRAGELLGPTAGLAPGIVQANVCILPQADAGDFLTFCRYNPKPCPLLAVSEPGDPMLPELGEDIDIRTDVPAYRIWRDGTVAETVPNLLAVWRDDFVAVALGCSFSFEAAMMEADIPLRHVERQHNVSMYRTSIACRPAGRFAGPMVVSMRPLIPTDAIRAIQITARFPGAHGAPVHFGDPAAIGIADIDRPDYGDPTEIEPGEVPVFWACGVTPQAVIAAARIDFAVTHEPGMMLISGLLNAELSL